MLILYSILGISSAVIAIKTRALTVSQLRQQVFAWWRIFPIVTLSLFFYPLGPLLLMLFICGLSMRELATHFSGAQHIFWLACGLVLVCAVFLWIDHSAHFVVFFPCLLILQLLFFMRRRDPNQLVLLLFLFCCYCVGFVINLMHLPLSDDTGLAWLFYLFALTALNDIAQFVSGKLFGCHAIASRISPNKTWEGLIGGVLISMLVSVLLGRYLNLADIPFLLLLALLLSLGGFAGDLLFSAAKRFLGIKDFSQLIPGHGGILDRIDSLTITAPLLYLAIYFSLNGFLL
ncbi:putative CDP-diglyceride synthetase/phosphatidate cytidylyltransferase [Solimicrobium silvestre]|uniref:Putative CDP-diglyceride synthetase/phosphatidate cytidylyltransferase n=2 Tax=Solimicrobium silvestre TaxID=2099400 RepID=A0A2S9H1D6_9BURK|nr:putative CDP-diglyceride synthetase/phosphatidate cytidylyltransferase [Solimicrobium silvestre]